MHLFFENRFVHSEYIKTALSITVAFELRLMLVFLMHELLVPRRTDANVLCTFMPISVALAFSGTQISWRGKTKSLLWRKWEARGIENVKAGYISSSRLLSFCVLCWTGSANGLVCPLICVRLDQTGPAPFPCALLFLEIISGRYLCFPLYVLQRSWFVLLLFLAAMQSDEYSFSSLFQPSFKTTFAFWLWPTPRKSAIVQMGRYTKMHIFVWRWDHGSNRCICRGFQCFNWSRQRMIGEGQGEKGL